MLKWKEAYKPEVTEIVLMYRKLFLPFSEVELHGPDQFLEIKGQYLFSAYLSIAWKNFQLHFGVCEFVCVWT